jgi:formylglycine-generating enzyme required for sulfatase activity
VSLGDGIGLELVLIRPGTFQMGSRQDRSEQPVHQVTIRKPFYIGKYEVTQEQWQAVMGANPSRFKGPRNPVESVSWDGCQGFVKKLSEKTGRKFSLPSEAEWEYACRAGTTTRFCFGDEEAGLAEYGWHYGNSDRSTHPVGQKKPNAWGLFDMHGNVLEWCEDAWHESYVGAPADGSPWIEGLGRDRVLRGGAWYGDPTSCRSADRDWFGPASGGLVVGARVVLRDF